MRFYAFIGVLTLALGCICVVAGASWFARGVWQTANGYVHVDYPSQIQTVGDLTYQLKSAEKINGDLLLEIEITNNSQGKLNYNPRLQLEVSSGFRRFYLSDMPGSDGGLARELSAGENAKTTVRFKVEAPLQKFKLSVFSSILDESGADFEIIF